MDLFGFELTSGQAKARRVAARSLRPVIDASTGAAVSVYKLEVTKLPGGGKAYAYRGRVVVVRKATMSSRSPGATHYKITEQGRSIDTALSASVATRRALDALGYIRGS